MNIIIKDVLYSIGVGFIFVGILMAGMFLQYMFPLFEKSEYVDSRFDGCWASVNGDNAGDWVCVNIRNIEYDRAIEVCNHEVGHEIFAEKCEKNPQVCLAIAQLMEVKNESMDIS